MPINRPRKPKRFPKRLRPRRENPRHLPSMEQDMQRLPDRYLGMLLNLNNQSRT